MRNKIKNFLDEKNKERQEIDAALKKKDYYNKINTALIMHNTEKVDPLLLAKKLLVSFLNNKGKVVYKITCGNCNKEQKEIIDVAESDTFKEEVKSGNIIWDIACLDSNNNIVFGIEIFYKHRTSNIKDRDDIPWVELKADEIIHKLDQINKPFELTIENIRFKDKCDDKYCLTLKEIAVKLYYLQQLDNVYACEARKIMDMAIRGTYVKSEEIWDTIGWTYDSDLKKPATFLWDILIARQKCIRCARKTNVSFKRPYCLNCYKHISDLNLEYCNCIDQHKICITDDEKNSLRKSLNWLNLVPGDWRVGTPCHFCSRTYIERDENDKFKKYWDPDSNYVNGYTWWFGGNKKRCCTVCLDQKCKEYGLLR